MARTPHAIPHTDPLELIDQIEMRAERNDDPYWRWIKELTVAATATANVDEAEDAALLEQTHAGDVIARANRYAGFVVGFRYATQLLRGEQGTAAPFPKERASTTEKVTSMPARARKAGA
jgi:hypothetical protein